jgi:hypothetical protein
MISLSTARQLRDAGLDWIPAMHDFFAIPDRGLDDRVFVINDIMAFVEIRQNLPMVTFHGTAEWALDYILTSEAIWLPTEEQLRIKLMHHLLSEDQPALNLVSHPEGYDCKIRFMDREHIFNSKEASEAYAAALLFVLNAI